ncbi:MAG: hypothetical protein Q4D65_06505 [Peptostreptococcaceae bacterium]|nr:hypothetical protein [Peptostreptococcaceae bacterium]
MDIVICRVIYPDDPTQNTSPHQHFIAYRNAAKDEVVLIPFKSAGGKERHVYYDIENSKVRDNVILFKDNDQSACRFNKPTFIDCRNAFRLKMDGSINLERLAHRDMPPHLKQAVLEKVYEMKSQNRLVEQMIDLKNFKNLNPRAVSPIKKQNVNTPKRQVHR